MVSVERVPSVRPAARRWRAGGVGGAVALVVTSALVALGGTMHANAAVAGYLGNANVKDSFARVVSGSFGTADMGGRYTVTSTTRTSVNKAGVLGPVSPGRSVSADLMSVSAADEQVQAAFSVDKLPAAGNGVFVGLELRRTSSGDGYRAKARVAPGGRVLISLVRFRDNIEQVLVPESIAPITAAAGRPFFLDMFVAGQGPTKVGMRISSAADTSSTWPITAYDAASTEVRGSGAVGVWTYVSRGSAANTVRVRSLAGWRLTPAAGGTSPTPTPTPGAPTGGTGVAGSVAVGSARYAVPSGALFVAPNGSDSAPGTMSNPFRTVQAAVNAARTGQTVVIRGGSYHESVLIRKNLSITIQAYPGEAVWFDGTVPVTNWQRSGSTWVSPGWTTNLDHSAGFAVGRNDPTFINPAYPMAAYPDMVFVDGVPQKQVAAGRAPAAGQFAVNTSAKTLTLGSDPSGRSVVSSTLVRAFTVAGKALMRGFGVRRYATPLPQLGAIFISSLGAGSVLENLVVQNNATQGISVGASNVTVRKVTSSYNGMVGFHGNTADGLVIDSSLAYGNNTEHFNSAPSAAGIKITRSRNISIVDSESSQNIGSKGIWLDESTVGFVIGNNVLQGNGVDYGIVTEISDTGIIAGNRISDHERGIAVVDTGNVKIFNNSVGGDSVYDVGIQQDERRQAAPGAQGRDPRAPVPDPSCPWVVRNILVANNVFTSSTNDSTAGYQLWIADKHTNTPASRMVNIVSGNIFTVPNATGPIMVGWGQADNRTITSVGSPAALNTIAKASWSNRRDVLSTGVVRALVAAGPQAVPLPSDVANVLGVSTGSTQYIGPP